MSKSFQIRLPKMKPRKKGLVVLRKRKAGPMKDRRTKRTDRRTWKKDVDL